MTIYRVANDLLSPVPPTTLIREGWRERGAAALAPVAADEPDVRLPSEHELDS